MMSFLPTASLENLRCRAELLRRLRSFFDRQGLIEVQVPVLSADTIVDRYVEPLCVTDTSLPETPYGNHDYFLQTSPEFAMKRLLAAGLDGLYQIGPVFRKGDRGKDHNVEFTMLEWYRAGDDYRRGMEFLDRMVREVAEPLSFFARKSPRLSELFSRPIPVRSYRSLFRDFSGLDPHRATCKQLRETAQKLEVAYPESFLETDSDTEPWLDLLFSETIQPRLEAAIVCDYPASQSQLARTGVVEDGIAVSERFELFLNGIEIANGYHELLDPETLRARFRNTANLRRQDGRRALPVESRLLQAMESGLPPSSGTALGVDRLLMVLLAAESLDEVLTFPIERA